MKIIKTLTTLGVVGILGATLASAQVSPIDNTNLIIKTGTKHSYAAMQNLTDAQKAIMVQVKDLYKAGKIAEAKALLTQNGINMPIGMHKGAKDWKDDKGNKQNHQKMEDAIIAGDFVTFQSVATNTKFAKIDQVTFNLLSPQYIAEKNAETQIQSILKNAVISQGLKDK